MTRQDEVLASRPAVEAARAEAIASRTAVADELERLEASARAAVDIPAKVRRNPARAAGVAAGAGFLVVGGPVKVLRGARNLVFGKPDPLPKAMLPDEIEKMLKSLGTDGTRVRGTLEREFAAYLREKAPERRGRDLAGLSFSSLGLVARLLLLRAGRRFVEELFSPDAPGFQEQLERIRGRSRGGGPGPGTGRPGSPA
jgi:hypothetical protein